MFRKSLVLAVLILATAPLFSGTGRYRATWRGNPSTSMVIGWDQQSGSGAVLYFDTTDHGTNTGSYAFSQTPSTSNSYKGMNNTFVRLTGLAPNTTYYFVIQDSDSTSARMKFHTAPNDDTPFTMAAGGDSRNNTSVRINANRMVAKLKPMLVMFGGDMTDTDSNSQWQAWLDHWQDTITSDGRLTPIVAARGNHEDSNASVYNLFDSPNNSVYFAMTFGADMLRAYTLNSEDVEGGNQASWLQSDLSNNQNVSWRFAQYHKPMRPHTSGKSEGSSEYNAWAQLFYDYKVQLVVECDSHVVKSTYPVRPSSSGEEGFVRDDENGVTFVGEGTWGAPTRSADDAKSWTRESGSFNQFKWIQVTRSQVTLRTVRYDNVSSVNEIGSYWSFNAPSGIDLWGSEIVIQASGAPSVNLTAPSEGALYNDGDTVNIAADASSPVGTIDRVEFSVDGNLIATDTSAPYTATWTAAGNGSHNITAEAFDDVAVSATDSVSVSVGVATVSSTISSTNDDVEEQNGGSMYMNSSDIELVFDGSTSQVVGLRFTGVNVPQGAVISDAYIQFQVDETNSGSTSLTIRGQDTGNASQFTTSNYNVSNRTTTAASVNWNPASWSSVGAAGSDQQTPNLAPVIQEIVDRGDWSSGNAIALIITGSGERTAESHDGSGGATLYVTFSSGGGTGNTRPNASFSTSVSQLQVDFTNNSTDSDGVVVSHSWDFGDGSGSSTANPSHTYGGSGTYTVDLTVTDDGGATDTTSQNITVNDGSWVTIDNNNFESGWGIYNDGGSDCRRSSNDSSYAFDGVYCVRIRDNTSTSNTTSDNISLSGYSEFRIDFKFIGNSMENGEDFFVEF